MLLRTSIFTLMVGLAVGCSSANHLEGTWVDPKGSSYVLIIKPDNTYTIDFSTVDAKARIAGIWTYSGVHLRQEPKQLTITGGSHQNEVRAMLERSVMKPVDEDLDWQDNDSFLAKQPNGTYIQLTRKK